MDAFRQPSELLQGTVIGTLFKYLQKFDRGRVSTHMFNFFYIKYLLLPVYVIYNA